MHISILKFARVRIIVTCYALVFLGSAYNGQISVKTLFALLVLIAWYIHAASANDYADRYIDKINLKNAKDRPLISKEISYKQLWTINVLSGIIALLLVSVYGLAGIMVMILMLTFDYLYSFKPFRISDRGLYAQITLASGYVLFPFSIGYWSTNIQHIFPWLLVFGIYLAFVARLLLKDFRDIVGDKKHGKLTFIVRHGSIITCITSGFLWLLALILTGFGISFYWGTMIVLILSFIFSILLLKQLALSKTHINQQELISLIAKLANISVITILTLLLCKNQSSLSNKEIELIPLVTGLTLIIVIFLKYKSMDISKSTVKI